MHLRGVIPSGATVYAVQSAAVRAATDLPTYRLYVHGRGALVDVTRSVAELLEWRYSANGIKASASARTPNDQFGRIVEALSLRLHGSFYALTPTQL